MTAAEDAGIVVQGAGAAVHAEDGTVTLRDVQLTAQGGATGLDAERAGVVTRR